MLRPIDEPILAKTIYEWPTLVNTALDSRSELREQMWRIKQRELQLLASKNFLLPRLDAVATFRNNGFGDTLGRGNTQFSSALRDSFSGDHNEWQVGLQLNVPVGFRQAWSGVRNSELLLRRERAILAEQELQITHDLGTAIRQNDLYYATAESAFNRLTATHDVVAARQAAFEADAVTLDLLLEGQQRLVDAQIAYERATSRYQLATISLARESGQLLQGFDINFTEAAEPLYAQIDRNSRRYKVQPLIDYRR